MHISLPANKAKPLQFICDLDEQLDNTNSTSYKPASWKTSLENHTVWGCEVMNVMPSLKTCTVQLQQISHDWHTLFVQYGLLRPNV